MKKALISPEETVYSYDGKMLGWRVAQVAATSFAVAKPLFWTDCADDVEADTCYYDSTTKQIDKKPVPPPPPTKSSTTTTN